MNQNGVLHLYVYIIVIKHIIILLISLQQGNHSRSARDLFNLITFQREYKGTGEYTVDVLEMWKESFLTFGERR